MSIRDTIAFSKEKFKKEPVEEEQRSESEAESEVEEVVEGQLYLFGTEVCPPCDEMKEILKDEIESGDVIPVTPEDEEGKRMISALQIKKVPILVLKDEEERYCELNVEGEIVACSVPPEESNDAEEENPA